jgi:small subunit ribosomal protein S9
MAEEKKKIVKKAAAKSEYFYGVGRRKRSNARAKYTPGTEAITIVIDGKKYAEYFPEFYRLEIDNMISASGVRTGNVEIFARGGGLSGQVDAAILALAKSFVKFDIGLKPVLRANGFLTTDVRKVLPKKAGLRKARKAEQWSKR